MTVHHYIASSREIPTGTFGIKTKLVPISDVSDIKIKGLKSEKIKRNKYINKSNLKEQYMIVYETEENFLGITVSELDGYDEISGKFINPFVYHLECPHSRRGYRDLFKYINENLSDSESIELYTCLDGEELKEKDDSLDIVVNLGTNHFKNNIGNFKLDEKRLFDELSERFSFRERQYVVVTK